MTRDSERVTKLRKRKFLNRKKLKLNVFDTNQSHIKFPVIGKSEKDSKGIPLLSRSKALLKRKLTLLKEYKNRNKVNKYLDRRIINISEKSKGNDDLRGVAQKLSLTHEGQHLDYSNKEFENASSYNKVNFVQTTIIDDIDRHFGGDFNDNDDSGNIFHPIDSNKKLSHEEYMSKSDFMQNIIEKSNQHKAEVDDLIKICEDLDNKWDTLRDLITKFDNGSFNSNMKGNVKESVSCQKVDDYDQELLFLNASKRVSIRTEQNRGDIPEDKQILKVHQDQHSISKLEKLTSKNRPILSHLNLKISVDSLNTKPKDTFEQPSYLKKYDVNPDNLKIFQTLPKLSSKPQDINSINNVIFPEKAKEFYKCLNLNMQTVSDQVNYLNTFQTVNKHISKDLYSKFLYVLLKYYSKYSSKNVDPSINHQIIRLSFSITKIDIKLSCNYFQKILLKIMEKFNKLSDSPDLNCEYSETLIFSSINFIEMISFIFPMSSYNHPVTSPAMVLSAKILNILTTSLSTLFQFDPVYKLMNVITKSVKVSKKVVPELIKCCERIMYTYLTKMIDGNQLPQLFVIKRLNDTNLSLDSSQIIKMLELLAHLIVIYNQDPCFNELFHNSFTIVRYLKNTKNIPKDVLSYVKNVLKKINSVSVNTIKPVVKLLVTPTRTINQLEPNVDHKSNPFSKNKSTDRNINERQKLKHKYKREFKGAVRELRRDNQFLANVQLKETLESDRERALKVKELFNLIAQENNYNDDDNNNEDINDKNPTTTSTM